MCVLYVRKYVQQCCVCVEGRLSEEREEEREKRKEREEEGESERGREKIGIGGGREGGGEKKGRGRGEKERGEEGERREGVYLPQAALLHQECPSPRLYCC